MPNRLLHMIEIFIWLFKSCTFYEIWEDYWQF